MFSQKFVILAVLLLSIELTSSQNTDVTLTSPSPNLQNHRQIVDESISHKDDKIHNIDPNVITNSHRPQYYDSKVEEFPSINRDTLDKIDIFVPDAKHEEIENNESFDETVDVEDNSADDEDEYKPTNHFRNKQNLIKSVLLKVFERNDQKRMFAEVLPILKMLTPAQRLVMSSLVTRQVTADARNPALTLPQVKAMFGNNANVTSDLMLPIMLDIANMFRDAKDHHRAEQLNMAPQAQLLRRSFSDDDEAEPRAEHLKTVSEVVEATPRDLPTAKSMKIAAKIPSIIKNSNVRVGSNLKVGVGNEEDDEDDDDDDDEVDDEDDVVEDDGAEVIKGNVTVSKPEQLTVIYPTNVSNQTKEDLESSRPENATEILSEDLPVAEKLRALNRFIDRNGNLISMPRPMWNQEALKFNLNRKNLNELLAQRRRTQLPNRQILLEMAKHKCDLFTNTLCLESIDYPADAIAASIRRNQGAMGALLADFPEISADTAIDGISAKQENRYTPEHYINNINRREDGQMAGSASGFMCPSTVKYARPQKARATSGQWKYIVNTGEHTQTLRLEKCLRAREPCTYLTDNFKSKCVQVYNYHRLLTWDQQNGLHMDIFKVPTCCSCHIEGYSVAFPPHMNKPSESPLEHFPGEDLSHDAEMNPFEEVQSSIRHSTHTNFPIPSPLDNYATLGETHNLIPGSSLHNPTFSEDSPMFHDLKHFPIPNQFESINNNFHTDIFQHQITNVRNIKKPPRIPTNTVGLPSFLEPPSKPVLPAHNPFKTPDSLTKHKPFNNLHFKRGVQNGQNPKRPNRRPLRKKNSNVAEDQLIAATGSHETPTIINMNSFEDINQSADKYERPTIRSTPMPQRTTTPKTILSSSKITIKNVAATTTERYRPKYKTTTERPTTPPPHRRVNYNYHPIIDFFEETSNKDAAADRRMDSDTVYLSAEDDWRPMANPIAIPLTSDPKSHNSG